MSSSSHFDLRLIYASDLEEALQDQQTINFAAIVDALDDGSMATLKLSAGDNYIPGPFFNAGGIRSVFRDGDVLNDAYNGLFGLSGAGSYDSLREQPGVVDMSIMNMIGFDASVVGNHEFDAGPSAFEDLVAADARGDAGPAGDRYVGALFPYLSSNLDFSGESGLQDLYTNDIVDASAGAPNTLAPAAFFDLDNGAGGTERVAVVGVTTPVLPAITSPGNVQVSGTAGLNRYPTTVAEYEAVTDALALEVQPVIDQALANGANKVVLVSHLQQFEMESRLAPKLAGIDVVIAGGSGTQATTAADGIEMTNADGDPVFVVSQNGQYSSVGELTLRFDSNGVPSLVNAREIQSDAAGVASVGGDVTTGSAALVGDLVAAVRDIVYTDDQDIRGYTDVYLQGSRGSIRTEETNFGNLAADSQLWYARQQDSTIQVSLKNGGGLRAPIGTIGGTAQNPTLEAPEALVAANDGYDKPAGGISQLDLQNTLRFNNNLVRVDTDAAGLRTLMEHSVNGSSPTATPGQFPQVSGMRFSFDYQQDFSEEEGQQRLQSLVLVDDAGDITDVIVQDGDLVGNPNRPVSMVTLGFLANNDGDSYPFSQVASSITDITDENGDRIYEQDALSDYLGAFHDTRETAYNIAETTADQDQRIINIGAGNANNIELAIDSGVAAADQPMASLDIGSAAEIGAYSAAHQVALATTGSDELALIDLSDLTDPALLRTIPLSGDLQSVAVSGDLVAVAVDGGGDSVPGEVQFLSLSGVGAAATLSLEDSVTVGALPDSLAFNADGSKLVVANEAQSIDITDPDINDAEGTISVIDTSSYVAGDISGFSVDTIDFTALNGQEAQLNAEGIRINPDAGSVAQDIEPEFVTVLGDRAWVSLQENNAIAEIDLTDNSLTDIWSLGLKDWSAIATDTSNRGEAGGAYGDKNLYGIKMPDGIDSFQTGGGTYIITANEGDDRDGDGDLNDAARVGDLTEDFGASAENQAYWQSQLGDRLKLSTTEGDTDTQPMASLDIGSAAEIGAYSAAHQVALATTGSDELALIDLSDLTDPALLRTIPLSGDLQSVAVSGDLVAVAVDGGGDSVPGEVQFLSLSGVGAAATLSLEDSVTVGALPDSLAFNADGSKLVVANEAQSIDITDPDINDAEGTISVIDTSSYVAGDISGFSVDTIDFTALNGQEAQLNAEGIRINPDAGSVAQDIEPEFVTVLGDRAWVSLQENNAIAEIDLTDNSLTDIWSLGLKDWSAIATDTSNRGEAGGAYGDKNLYGIKMPDGIDSFQTGGGTYIITANEGDDRDGDGDLNDAARVGDLTEDFGASAENQAYWQSQLGDRLKLSTTEGDLDGDGDIDVAHAFGGRSFSIYDDAGHLVFDSGNQLDEIAKAAGIYDDGRSDDKGMEPEMVLTQAINDSVYAFVGLERADHSAIAMYDVTVPELSTFVQLFTNSTDNANADSGAESWGPEGLVFIPTEVSGAGVLMATNEGDDSPQYEGQIDFYSVLETNRPGAPVSGNNDLEVAYAFGGRSFSIYDDAGHLVFDSGNQLDEIAKAAGIYDDGRSDDKGMEPEMVLTQAINDSVYAFVGLERADHSAIAMYDVTEPEHSRFIKLLTNSADNTNADSGAESWGPEGLVFIPTEASGAGVLMATNEGDDSPQYEGQIDLYDIFLDQQPHQYQQVNLGSSDITYVGGSTIYIPVSYSTNTSDANLTGLTLNLHYNSSLLTPIGVNSGVGYQVPADITGSAIIADIDDLDMDATTDSIVEMVWASFNSSFPGTDQLPTEIATVSFSTADQETDPLTGQPMSTTLNTSASNTAIDYDFISTSITLGATPFSLDVDGDGQVTALGDGLMVIRKLFGATFSGDSLTNKAISRDATRTTAEISDYIQSGIDGGLLDVDRDGLTTPLGDGLMVIRSLLGDTFTGSALTNKAISPASIYANEERPWEAVAANIDSLMLG